MIKNITYEDKIAIQNDESVDRKNKVTDADMNEIKEVVNANADEQTTQNTDISNIKKEQETQNTNIEENNSKIVELQNEKAKLETELKEMQEDFYQNSIRGQASGEYIHVEDSSNCRSIIGIGGNHEQETRSGKNKIEITKTTTTVNGCTHTIKDGTDTLSGTSTGWANLIIYSFTGNGKTYTLSGSPQSSKNIFISAHDNTQNKDLVTSKNGNAGTFVATSGNSIDIIICVAPNLTLANELFKPQLEEGSTVTEWEQGGVSPSPDYLSEIKSVGSNVNLLENKITSQKIKGIDVEVKDNGKIILNGIATENFALVIGTINKLKNMTFSGMCDGYGYNKMILQIQGKDYNVNVVNSNQITLSDLDTVATVRLYIYKGTSIINAIIEPKIVEGTEVGEYSSYGQGCVKVTKCNKNLFPALKSQSKENKGIIFSYNAETQEFRAKGTTTDTSFYTTLTFEELKYLSKDKKYILSISNLMPTKCMVALTKINKIDNGIINEGKKQTTVDNLDKYKPDGFMFYGQNLEKGTKIDFTFKAQIEEGLTATEYEQHEEQSYIMPTQTEMLENDYLDYDNEEEVHTWGKKILTGDENWAYEKLTSAYGEKNNFYLKIDDAMSNGKVYSNAFVQRPTLADNYSMYISAGKNLNLRYQEKSSSTEFKAYLKSQYDAGTPVVIYYKLQTPTRLAFTDEQKAVAKELSNARTYKNVTNITTDSKAILSLDYAKDLETLLNNTQALAVNNASEGV